MGGRFKRAIVLGNLILAMAGLWHTRSRRSVRRLVASSGSPGEAESADGTTAASAPMIFYVAHGPTGACGPNCGEWIAAEGSVQWDTYKRLIGDPRPPGPPQAAARHQRLGAFADVNVAASLGRILRGPRHRHRRRDRPKRRACNGKSVGGMSRPQAQGGVTRSQESSVARDVRCLPACFILAGGVHRNLPPGDQGCRERQPADLQPLRTQCLRGTAREPGDRSSKSNITTYLSDMGDRSRIARPWGEIRGNGSGSRRPSGFDFGSSPTSRCDRSPTRDEISLNRHRALLFEHDLFRKNRCALFRIML